MSVPVRSRPLFRYLVAVAVSGLAIGLIAVLQPVVGFLELLYLAAVAFVDAYVGEGPAILAIALCSLGSLSFIGSHAAIDPRVHNIAKLIVFPLVAGALLYLMKLRQERKRFVQEQLSELSTLLESIPEAVFIFDATEHVVNVNAAGQALGGGVHDLRGRLLSDLIAMMRVEAEGQAVQPPNLAVRRALAGEVVRDVRRVCYSVRQPDTPVHMMVSAYPIRGTRGRVIGAMLILRDVTEMTQMQQRIADTERHLVIGQMATSIAHDFNNVLNSIRQAAAILELPPDRLQSDRRLYASIMDKAIDRGAEIVQRLREYVKGGTGEVTQINLAALLEEVLDLTRPLVQSAKNVHIKTDLRAAGPVRANAADLRRVFVNLIVNAIQAMPDGGEMTINSEENEGRVRVRVRDTGTGIAPEQRSKIFLPYYTTKSAGTGLGLSTAQKILLAHGGNISFESEPGKGTVFNVELPVATQEELLVGMGRPERAA